MVQSSALRRLERRQVVAMQDREGRNLVGRGDEPDRRDEEDEQCHEKGERAIDAPQQPVEEQRGGKETELAHQPDHDAGAEERLVGEKVRGGRGGVPGDEDLSRHVEENELLV